MFWSPTIRQRRKIAADVVGMIELRDRRPERAGTMHDPGETPRRALEGELRVEPVGIGQTQRPSAKS